MKSVRVWACLCLVALLVPVPRVQAQDDSFASFLRGFDYEMREEMKIDSRRNSDYHSGDALRRAMRTEP
ncbi:MAG: hypothetical protein A2091_11335 [Desulfuromonadales bacterium GWD2_61_12]|nr:MAG: hypothetical protein A2005_09335 [Desulfuromonadales bacterium GWC2_61_20]OGR36777.1 MAG: hypothetical protein A2091_11335 [Desulfuromonadales bacterium GWD2_61_12]HAD04147.1 hypothetical protein [Desulfuromonas sp.]HBT83514.1 hypothetical protein [Desulfuromonas sp.]